MHSNARGATVVEEPEIVPMSTEAVWSSENFEVKHSIVNSWDGGYQGEVLITKLDDNTMEDWNLMFEMNMDIVQIWNASIDLSENNLYIIKNDNWNANISAGGSVELTGDSYGITYEARRAGNANDGKAIKKFFILVESVVLSTLV